MTDIPSAGLGLSHEPSKTQVMGESGELTTNSVAVADVSLCGLQGNQDHLQQVGRFRRLMRQLAETGLLILCCLITFSWTGIILYFLYRLLHLRA